MLVELKCLTPLLFIITLAQQSASGVGNYLKEFSDKEYSVKVMSSAFLVCCNV